MTIASPTLWAITIGLVVVLIGVDFLLTRRPHDVSTREAALWSAFYIAVPVAFGIFAGAGTGIGDMVMKSVEDLAPTAALPSGQQLCCADVFEVTADGCTPLVALRQEPLLLG